MKTYKRFFKEGIDTSNKTEIQLNISPRQGTGYSCGANCLETIFAYYGIEYREGQMIEKLGTTPERGTKYTEIRRVAEEEGFTVIERREATVEDLKSIIDEGYPVMVVIQAWADEINAESEADTFDWENYWDSGHWVVCDGYTDKAFLFEDPATFRKAYIPIEEFKKRWHDIGDNEDDKFINYLIYFTGKEPNEVLYERML